MLDKNSVYNGDCLELMKDIDDKSIDMILCDLPYGTTACKWDVIIPFDLLWQQYKRIIKDNGAIVLTASQPFTSALVMSNPKMFKYEWIWEKKVASNSQLAKYQPLKIHENILVFGNSIIYKPQGLLDCNILRTNDNRSKGVGHIGSEKKRKEFIQTKTGYPKSIVNFKPSNINKLHPTQKPVTLFEYLIKTYTNEGDLVLDNCAGSGTTAIACMNTNRNYILMEKEQKYYDIIQDRIKEHTNQINLF